MADGIETAARMFARMTGEDRREWQTLPIDPDDRDAAAKIMLSWFREVWGCGQCEVLGSERQTDHAAGTSCTCPAEHVEYTFLGETVWCNPAKMEWHCSANPIPAPWGTCSRTTNYVAPEWRAAHKLCGLQPRWDVLNQEQT